MSLPVIPGIIDLNQTSLWISVGSIIFNPTFWNIVARNEYRNATLTKTLGSPHAGCYALAVTIFSLGIIRDWFYKSALEDQPLSPALSSSPLTVPAAYALLAGGNVLVLSSMWALGVTGTYLGDYFGILMEDMVEGFPFNVTGSPMYWGSTMSFLGTALLYERPAGLVISGLVFVAYYIALKFEDPFTAGIYAKRERERAAKGKGKARATKKTK